MIAGLFIALFCLITDAAAMDDTDRQDRAAPVFVTGW
jgi:hypothetical protein